MKRPALFLTLLLPILASCGPPLVWDKPGLDPTAKANDQTDCQRLAWRQAVGVENDLMFQSRLGMPRTALRYGYYPQPNFNRYDWEDRFFATCMQAKGYRLIPLKQGGDNS
jgi:hypothetical protein